jgi:hypothetical protein
VALGLVELLINGIEHGNLGISFHDKGRAARSRCLGERSRSAARTRAERRQVRADPRAARRQRNGASRFAIAARDSKWRRYLDLDESRALHPNGRGIAVARHIAFRSLEFVEPGNEVIVSVTTVA